VTSWGYTDNTIKIQGASMFATNNEFPNTRYGAPWPARTALIARHPSAGERALPAAPIARDTEPVPAGPVWAWN
jgi:hypothetical protein